MRTVYLIALLAFLGVILVFSLQNTQVVTVRFTAFELTSRLAYLVTGVYALGMFSGAAVVGVFRRIYRGATA